MNPKIPKLREEHGRNKAKISELQARNRELEKQIRELENTEIIGLVRAQGLSLEDFAALLRSMKAPAPIIPTFDETEEPKHEEV
jgi:hypothetical protein